MKRPKAIFGPIMQVKNGQSYTLKLSRSKVLDYDICCDCGLVHLTEYKVKKNQLQFTVWRDEKQTKKQRKRKQVISTV